MLKMDRPNRLGRASLETLAIIAYRQPLTKSEIEDIRGVDVTANIKTLMDLQLIRLVGKSELPGHPFLYGTTPLFLEHFGLASLQQLNELDPTLQRSNPKKKAEAYRRPVKEEKTELEQAAEEKEAPEVQEGTPPPVAEAEEPEADDSEEPKLPYESSGDDDDFEIDDTPDEFDEDDDDEDEDDFEEEDDDDEEDADGTGDPDDPDRV